MRVYFEKLFKGSRDNYLLQLKEKLAEETKTFIVTANPEAFMFGEQDPEMNALLLDEETSVVADGIGIVKAAAMLDIEVAERIPGVDIAEQLMIYGNELGKSIFLLGSKQEVIDAMCKVMAEKYPNLKVAGAINGYVPDKDAAFEEIKKAAPDIVLVALGIPAQEKLIYKHLKDFNKGIFVGVGGSLDVLSGSKERAPEFFINHNLEWAYRIAKEPKRLKRFYNSHVKFIFKVQKEKRG
ncbi:MAG: WecB/TagA/CpsF family glycosyltransferase [Clostridia bacterium]|nr:WecB/TagA/CpsF family glycosyltransferase [Clostridia bacterium]MBQ8893200.1 WecB/TagA/CpsF family glycosyltransferase [Clostridia bacterium]